MTTNLTPTAVIERQEATDWGPPHYTVWVEWPNAGVDRPRTHGYGVSIKNRRLAERLVRAIEAGVVETNPAILTDIYGQTYVGSTSTVLARMMNADLRRLGY